MEFIAGIVLGFAADAVMFYYYGKRAGVAITQAFAAAQQVGSNVETAKKDLSKAL